jgi:uncharacterized membrane protein
MSATDKRPLAASHLPKDQLEAAGFHPSMAHLYRGEMNRMTVWRERLDVTSNWAILLTVGLTTFTLGSEEVPHYILLLGLALIAISILIEARRYRHLHHCKWRLHLLEVGYFGTLLDPSTEVGLDWRGRLARDLRQPKLLISWLTAIRARLRRNYLLLLYFVTGVWVTKLFIHPHSPATLDDFFVRLSVGDFIPTWFVAVTAPAFVLGATLLALTCPSLEKLEDWTS